MALFAKLKKAFRNILPFKMDTSEYLFNYQRLWKRIVLLTSIIALAPLISIILADHKVTRNALESEFYQSTTCVVSTTEQAIESFLNECRSALDFIVRCNPLGDLDNPNRLGAILDSMQQSFDGCFVDLGVISAAGELKAYAGPLKSEHRQYNDKPWFKKVIERGVCMSSVIEGYGQTPHLIIAVKQNLPDGGFQVVRASLSISPLEKLLSGLEPGGSGDAFMVNQQAILQTHSRYHGKISDKLPFKMPPYNPAGAVIEAFNPKGEELLVGYRFIEKTPFVLMIVKNKQDLMQHWHRMRLRLLMVLAVSVTVILGVILGAASYIVRHIHMADEDRLISLHQVEYANKMASIGRMATNVAHEINNPLAIINEKAGLIQDLFTLKQQYAGDEKLSGLLASIRAAVQRAGKITKKLLTFARNFEAAVETINIEDVTREVFGFLEKEAQSRSIEIQVDVAPETPSIESDRGKLQQIFLNIINNAFAAMKDGNRLEVTVRPEKDNTIKIRFSDNGCGIPDENLRRIFDPFYSTRTKQGGTGLGLSITYNLIQEIGGDIKVTSTVGKGTCFTIALPLKTKQQEE